MIADLRIGRRQLMRSSLLGLGASPWFGELAAQAADAPARKKSCILLWMSGGPSQLDTFDPKPDHPNGGPFRPIETAAPGLRIGEHLPRLADEMRHYAVIRSMRTREGDHGRATAHLRTGYTPQGSIRFPTLGALVSNERADRTADLPGFVSVMPEGAFTLASIAAGFLGPQHAPLVVDGRGGSLHVDDLQRPTDRSQRRSELLRDMEASFLATRPGPGTASHVHAYDRADRLQRPDAAAAFDLDRETPALRDRYGRGSFGQGCLLARRLIERGVPFVEVTLGGWDTHNDNFGQVRRLCDVLDPAWASLTRDLRERGLLGDTLIVWMGEFGRTPGINPRSGRDHYPPAWSVVLGGGGIRGGQVVGRTSASGLGVEERPVAVPDLIATICLALGLDPMKQNPSNVNRPIRLADPAAQPIRELL